MCTQFNVHMFTDNAIACAHPIPVKGRDKQCAHRAIYIYITLHFWKNYFGPKKSIAQKKKILFGYQHLWEHLLSNFWLEYQVANSLVELP